MVGSIKLQLRLDEREGGGESQSGKRKARKASEASKARKLREEKKRN